MNIVLVEPLIPQNTGNIARSCAVTDTTLHLVRPLGFEVDDSKLKRAGLDYWHLMNIRYHDNMHALMAEFPDAAFFFLSTRAHKSYTDVKYPPDAFLVFGKETSGLPASLLASHPENCLRIPMRDETRSLNLSNCAAIVLFEALRQNGFPGMR